MPTLQPQASFTIVRQIGNHLDTDTKYVQAVIRNAFTDAIIQTVNLVDKGSNRFKFDWQVPADPSGQGFYIAIVTSVYADSAYTSKNPNYADEGNTYLIQDRTSMHRGGGNLGIADVRRVIQEELAAKKQAEAESNVDAPADPAPEEEPMRWDDVLKAIDTLRTELKPEKTDFSPLLSAIQHATNLIAAVGQAVTDKEVTPPTDLKPIIDEIRNAQDDKDITDEEMRSLLNGLETKLTETIMQSVQKAISEANFVTSFITHVGKTPVKQPAEAKPDMGDITKLAV